MSLIVFVTLMSIFIAQMTDASDKISLEKQMLSLNSIKNFFSSIDKSVIDRIRDTVNLSKLINRVRKLLQIKLREELIKRMEPNGDKSVEKLEKLNRILLAPIWLRPSLMRLSQLKQDKNTIYKTPEIEPQIIRDEDLKPNI